MTKPYVLNAIIHIIVLIFVTISVRKSSAYILYKIPYGLYIDNNKL